MNGNTSVANQESSGEIPAPHLSKKSMNSCIEDSKKKQFNFIRVTPPQRQHSSVPRESRLVCDSPMRESEGGNKDSTFPAYWDIAKGAHFCLTLPRSLKCGGSWEQRKGVNIHSDHYVDLKNQLQILLGGLQTLQRGLSMNFVGYTRNKVKRIQTQCYRRSSIYEKGEQENKKEAEKNCKKPIK